MHDKNRRAQLLAEPAVRAMLIAQGKLNPLPCEMPELDQPEQVVTMPPGPPPAPPAEPPVKTPAQFLANVVDTWEPEHVHDTPVNGGDLVEWFFGRFMPEAYKVLGRTKPEAEDVPHPDDLDAPA